MKHAPLAPSAPPVPTSSGVLFSFQVRNQFTAHLLHMVRGPVGPSRTCGVGPWRLSQEGHLQYQPGGRAPLGGICAASCQLLEQACHSVSCARIQTTLHRSHHREGKMTESTGDKSEGTRDTGPACLSALPPKDAGGRGLLTAVHAIQVQ